MGKENPPIEGDELSLEFAARKVKERREERHIALRS
jgi:hypothetical protein